MYERYANENFDRISALAEKMTQQDREAGRDAPAHGYSKDNWIAAEKSRKDIDMGQFDKIGEAPVFEYGVKLPSGFDGDIKIQTVIAKNTFKAGLATIVEFTLLSSNMVDHPPGSERSWFVSMQNNMALPNLKQFTISVFDIDHDSPEEARISAGNPSMLSRMLERAVSEDNVLLGHRVHVTTSAHKTREQRDYVRHTYAPYRSGPSNPSFDVTLAMPSRVRGAPPPPPNGYRLNPTTNTWEPDPPPPNGYRLNPTTNTWEPDR